MKLITDRNTLQSGLMHVLGGIEKKQTMQILGNVYLDARDDGLTLIGTDMEIQLSTHVAVSVAEPGTTTVNARKFNDIIKAAPGDAEIRLILSDQWLTIQINRSQFRLATLDPADFPRMAQDENDNPVRFVENQLVSLIESTQFAMAQQDVRYFLNGMLLEITPEHIRTVATDGHRLALSEVDSQTGIDQPRQMIIPRKTILELTRLLSRDSEETITLLLANNQISATIGQTTLISKLIDGRFPDYERVIPKDNDKMLTVNCQDLRGALMRASVLSNERFSGASFAIDSNVMTIEANNADQESSQEEVAVDYQNEPMKIAFNISYLINVIQAMDTEDMVMELKAPEASALLHATRDGITRNRYVLMPMKI